MSKHLFFYLLSSSILILTEGCTFGISNYHHVDSDGWIRTDSIHIQLSHIDSGQYTKSLALRILKTFPLQDIKIGIKETLHPKTNTTNKIQKIHCRLADSKGHISKRGIDHAEYTFVVDTITIAKNDTIEYTIFHCLKQDTIEGINAIGIELEKVY